MAIGPGAYNLYKGVGVGAGGTNDVEDSKVAIGYNAGNSSTSGVYGAATQAVAIGSGATNSWICDNGYPNTGPIAIGYLATAGCWNTVVIGAGANHYGADSIAIGGLTVGTSIDSIIMGHESRDNGFTGLALS